MFFNTLQSTDSPPAAENGLVKHVTEARVEKLCFRPALSLIISYGLKLNRSHPRMILLYFTYCQDLIFSCGGTALEPSFGQNLVSYPFKFFFNLI